jgi:hypothetical protein
MLKEETMTTWEYKTVPIPPHIATEVLNTWGEDGWELVCVFSPPEVGGTIAYFKRQRQG